MPFPLKRIAAVGALATLTACTSGAGGSAPQGSSRGSSSSSSSAKLKSVTFVNPLPDYPAWKVIGQCMGDQAKKKGLEFSQSGQTGSAVDTSYMINRIQQAIAVKRSAIVTFPVSAQQFDPLFLQAKRAGILTATVEGGQTKNNDVNVGTSFTEFGALAAETVARKGGQQNIAFISEGPTGPPQTFVNAFKTWVDSHPNSKKIKVLDTRYDGGDPTKDPAIVQAMLTAHPTLNMIVTNEGTATSPVISVLKQQHLLGKVYLTTNSKFSGSVEGMQTGYVYSFLVQDMCGIGTTAIDAIVGRASGTLKGTNVATKILFATKDNYKKILASGFYQ